MTGEARLARSGTVTGAAAGAASTGPHVEPLRGLHTAFIAGMTVACVAGVVVLVMRGCALITGLTRCWGFGNLI